MQPGKKIFKNLQEQDLFMKELWILIINMLHFGLNMLIWK